MTDNQTPRQLSRVEAAQEEEIVRIVDLYQSPDKIYTRRIKGFYRKLQHWTWLPLLSAYFLLPWFNLDGRQIVWFDLPARKFYVFGLTFWPQDFMLLAWLLIIAAFGLFAVTVLVGRVWCGFTCPQTVWTMLFMGAEHFWEGDRNQRIKLDKAPWTFNKVMRKTGKQATWVIIALATGLTFVGYFNPIRELVPQLFTFQSSLSVAFWTLFFTGATYMNAGFMREQVCKYMCPYARFQSAMFDSDTMIVSYDEKRGEVRGPRKKGAEYRAEGLGDCVDCTLCVQVCPVGIDIRDGLQYECISCGLCVDACNLVMDKMEYERGLISFTTENMLKTGATRILRPRLIGYVLGVVAMSSAFLYTMAARVPLEVDIERDRGALYRETSQGLVENTYILKINNMDNRNHRYRVSIDADYDFIFKGDHNVSVAGGEISSVLVRLQLDPGRLDTPNNRVKFIVESIDHPDIHDREESRFIGPRVR